ncbi:MAG: hypothetical protein ACI93R_004134 [Flavobacteriales bacterium]
MNKRFNVVLGAAALCFSTISFAENEIKATSDTGRWSWGGEIATVSINDEVAREQAIDNSAVSFGGYADYSKKHWLATLGLGFVAYDDNAGFSQRTEDNFGNDNNTSSSASAISVNAAIGPKLNFNDDGFVFAQVGYDQLVASERSISNCTNCFSEKIDVNGGLFLSAGVKQNVGKVAIGALFKNYLSDDGLETSIGIVMSSAY